MPITFPKQDYDYDYDLDADFVPKFAGPPTRGKRIFFFILFLVFTWFTLPPIGDVKTAVLSTGRDTNNTVLYATVEVQNKTHTFIYDATAHVQVTDAYGNVVGKHAEKVAAVLPPLAKRKMAIEVPLTQANVGWVSVRAATSSWHLLQFGFPTKPYTQQDLDPFAQPQA